MPQEFEMAIVGLGIALLAIFVIKARKELKLRTSEKYLAQKENEEKDVAPMSVYSETPTIEVTENFYEQRIRRLMEENALLNRRIDEAYNIMSEHGIFFDKEAKPNPNQLEVKFPE